MPEQAIINKMKPLLSVALSFLSVNDRDLVELPEKYALGKYDRKLHEVCINHRLACYIEKLLPDYFSNNYKVDIEYNRYYKDKKTVQINDTSTIIVRPDIIVHTRAEDIGYYQHLLVIEAKKDRNSQDDEAVVQAFIRDPKYNYLFGATIRYNNLINPQVKLYYIDHCQEMQCDVLKPSFAC